jgi:hypothetical protein
MARASNEHRQGSAGWKIVSTISMNTSGSGRSIRSIESQTRPTTDEYAKAAAKRPSWLIEPEKPEGQIGSRRLPVSRGSGRQPNEARARRAQRRPALNSFLRRSRAPEISAASFGNKPPSVPMHSSAEATGRSGNSNNARFKARSSLSMSDIVHSFWASSPHKAYSTDLLGHSLGGQDCVGGPGRPNKPACDDEGSALRTPSRSPSR